MKIGILALQGAFSEHAHCLTRLGVEPFFIRNRADMKRSFDGLILPGGESTAMAKLLAELRLFEPIESYIQADGPVFGTCAGLILLAKTIQNDDRVHFATMDIVCRRNAYGRQLGSFSVLGSFHHQKKIPMVFIRAPYILSVGDSVEVLSEVDHKIVAARQNRQLVTAFHPELTDDLTVHRYFIEQVCSSSVRLQNR